MADRRAPPVRVLALVGPTGAGKTGVALEVADDLGAEVVAVDAFTVYRGMDVGTAKPDAAARAAVRHHVIDVLEPEQDCTVQWFQRAARAAIADIRGRGRLPLLVGGSGLYFRAVVDPLEFPPTEPTVRRALEARWAEDPLAAHRHLLERDPEAAAHIEPGNLRRTIRALEVLEVTGRPFSSYRTAWDRHRSCYPGLRVVGLAVDRGVLRERLDARVDAMLAAGLVDECRGLMHRALSTTARQAIGYAELLEHLAGHGSLADAVAAVKRRSRGYAIRQLRWFQGDPRVEWVAREAAAHVLARSTA